jgi:hypothetical protein
MLVNLLINLAIDVLQATPAGADGELGGKRPGE